MITDPVEGQQVAYFAFPTYGKQVSICTITKVLPKAKCFIAQDNQIPRCKYKIKYNESQNFIPLDDKTDDLIQRYEALEDAMTAMRKLLWNHLNESKNQCQ